MERDGAKAPRVGTARRAVRRQNVVETFLRVLGVVRLRCPISFPTFAARKGATPSKNFFIRSDDGRLGEPSLPAVLFLCLLCLFAAIHFSVRAAETTVAAPTTDDRATVIAVVGAAGEEEFGNNFSRQAAAWKKACDQAGANFIAIGWEEAPTVAATASAETDAARLKATLAAEAKTGLGQLWIVLIGHGTFDGKEPKFNLRGPDVAAAELVQWLQPFQRPVALIDTSSSSAPFLNQLTGKNRVVITATRSGYEQNFARFGEYLAEAVTSPDSDLDKDGQTSLLEAFLSASYRVVDFYKTENRLATEHALIDDNGDGMGTPAEWFRGIRATKQAKDGAALDGLRAHQFILVRSSAEQKLSPEMRLRRDELELSIARLREQKAKLEADAYYAQLEKLMLQLAELYRPGT